MATTTKSGNLIKLYLRENGSTTAFKYVVCNEDLSLDGTSDEISRPTKCGTLKTPGTPSFETPFSGVANFTPDADQISHNDLYNWFAAGTILDFVIGDASTGGTVLDFSGTCSITALTIQAPVDDFVGFDGTLAISGTPVNGI
jgi:hypothetical protein